MSLREYIESNYTLKQLDELRKLMGWTPYQWTWHINHPKEWHRHTVVTWAYYTKIPLHVWREDYSLGENKTQAVA